MAERKKREEPESEDSDAEEEVVETGVEPEEEDDPIVTTSSGFRVRCKAAPTTVINKALRKMTPPEMPTVYIEDKERTEENPDDPGYREAMTTYANEQTSVVNNTMLLFGTEILEPIPEDARSIDDEAWVEDLKFLGLELDGTRPDRYVMYLFAEVMPADADVVAIMGEVGRRSRIARSDVDLAVSRFRRAATGGTDPDVPADG